MLDELLNKATEENAEKGLNAGDEYISVHDKSNVVINYKYQNKTITSHNTIGTPQLKGSDCSSIFKISNDSNNQILL